MISKAVFSTWMGILADRFGRELKPPTLLALYTDLGGELTDEQFVVGCRICLRREEFFPAPQKIIDAARPPCSPELEAADLFDRIRDHWYYYDDPLAKEAVRLTGGREVICIDSARELPYVRREFIKVYVALLLEHRDARERERLLKSATPLSRGLATGGRMSGAPRSLTDGPSDVDHAVQNA